MMSYKRLSEMKLDAYSGMPDPDKEALLAEVSKLQHTIRRLESELGYAYAKMRTLNEDKAST